MSKARDISRFGDERGIGEPTSTAGDPGALFASVSTTATVTSDTTLSTGGPYFFFKEKNLDVETGINLTVGLDKNLVVDSLLLP
jgi:hypothetical protein